MANQTSSLDSYPQQKRVAIAIGSGRYQLEAVAGGLALRPKLVAGTAEKSNVPTPERLLERLPIHEAEHEHLAARCVLHDGGREPLLIEFEIHTGHRMGNPRAAHCSFTSPIESEPK